MQEDLPPPPPVQKKVRADQTLSGQQTPALTLYIRTSCPYCKKILDYLKEHRKTLPICDADRDPAIATALRSIGGKTQFPCLLINGKPLYESVDILHWLKKHKDLY